MITKVWGLAIATFTMLFAPMAQAQVKEWELGAALEARLGDLRAPYLEQGWSAYAGPFILGIAQAQTLSVRVPAPPSGVLSVMGICDRHCYDINLRARTADGALLAEDFRDGDLPEIVFSAPPGASVLIEMTMSDCGDRVCFSRFDIYHRATAPAP